MKLILKNFLDYFDTILYIWFSSKIITRYIGILNSSFCIYCHQSKHEYIYLRESRFLWYEKATQSPLLHVTISSTHFINYLVRRANSVSCSSEHKRPKWSQSINLISLSNFTYMHEVNKLYVKVYDKDISFRYVITFYSDLFIYRIKVEAFKENFFLENIKKE